MEQFRFIWQYIKRHKWQYIGGIVTLFVLVFANLYIPKVTGIITDGLAAHTIDRDGVLRNIGIILGIGLTLAVGRFLWRYFIFGASRSVEHEIRDNMFAHLETLDVEYYNEHKTGDLMTRFTSDLNAVRMAIGPAVIAAFDAVVMTVMVIGQMMIYVNIKLTLIAIIPMIFIAFGELYYGKIMQKRFLERQEAVSELTDFVQESFSGVRVVKAFVRERAQIKEFAKANANAKNKNLRIAQMESIVIPLLDVVIGISSLTTLLYGG
ncbi:MAG: ABC transporter ATP-binding protein, partial [Lachnospiraceae bacterium]|nr:ABC transporter ATP-binding protein [Lachnospiraceae bacterium]